MKKEEKKGTLNTVSMISTADKTIKIYQPQFIQLISKKEKIQKRKNDSLKNKIKTLEKKEKIKENNNDNDVINLQQKYNINIDNIDLKIEDNKIEGNNLDNLNIIEDQGGGNNINNIISQENIIDNNLIEKK